MSATMRLLLVLLCALLLSAPSLAARAPAETYLWDDLQAAPFPEEQGHPKALVYLPSGFTPRLPVSLVVYLHGYENCVENVARTVGQPCTPGGAPRAAHALLRTMEASGRNAILLCPELAFDQRSSNPGNLAEPAGFRALIEEVLDRLRDRFEQPISADDLGRVVLVAHSAGFQAAAAILHQGWVRVDEVYLLDALYAGAESFESWVLGGPRRRLVNIYTRDGGTWKISRKAARRLQRAAGSRAVVDERRPGAPLWPALSKRVVFKRTTVAHQDVPRVYLADLLRASGLPALPGQIQRRLNAEAPRPTRQGRSFAGGGAGAGAGAGQGWQRHR